MNNKTKTVNVVETRGSAKAEVLLIALDVHSDRIALRAQYDGSQPEPGQMMDPQRFRQWVLKQRHRAKRVVCCYEAGPFGFGLVRFLREHGIECLVVAPENLDSQRRGVKTDKADALQLLRRLRDYIVGNQKAFSVVRVPTRQQEQERCELRLREQLKDTRQRIQKQGKSLLLQQGIKVSSSWWKDAVWDGLKEGLEDFLVQSLEPLRRCLEKVDEEEQKLCEKLKSVALPEWNFVGLGPLCWQQIQREVCDWSRFGNRRNVAGYTGLCPSVHISNGRGHYGSVNKHGNPRLRWALIELAWRVKRYQPGYWKLKKLQDAFDSKDRRQAGRRKRAIVALARQLAIDLWRLATGQTTPEALGLRRKSA